jgi:YVTN family beta-propeller protein
MHALGATSALGVLSAGLAEGSAFPAVRTSATTVRQTDARQIESIPASSPASPFAIEPTASQPSTNVWAATTGRLHDVVADLPPRVYVPHELGGDITVIDPTTMEIVDRFWVGRTPHHVAPAHNLFHLYVNVMDSNLLVQIDPRSGERIGYIPVPQPYNLYFTPDSTTAVVAAERYNRLDFYDAVTWAPLARLPIPGSGVDHLDFSADGSYLLVSCEFGGQIVKVNIDPPAVLGVLRTNRLPIDVKLSPDGALFYVADQGRNGVSVVDPDAMQEVAFLPTGRGAHGMAISRDTRALYVSNRLAGTISVIDFEAVGVATTWWIGGSPDMLQVSPDGQQLWASNRYHGTVSVVDTNTGQMLHSIRTGAGPHGLTYFPQPGRYSLGHNGVYR